MGWVTRSDPLAEREWHWPLGGQCPEMYARSE